MKPLYIAMILTLSLCCSCREPESIAQLGEATYYPSFPFCPADSTPIHKTLHFDFSKDALAADIYAEMAFVDNKDKIISPEEMDVYLNGERLENNTFRIKSNIRKADLIIYFTEKAHSGKKQGYLRLLRHNLNRIENQPLRPDEPANILQWTIHFKRQMNPLAETLLWIAAVLGACLLIWFSIFRPILYPHFRKMVKTVSIEQEGKKIDQFKIKFTNVRKVVLWNHPIKQSKWQRCFVGKTYVINKPYFTTPLTFQPFREDATATGVGYMSSGIIPRSGNAEIKYPQQGIIIILK